MGGPWVDGWVVMGGWVRWVVMDGWSWAMGGWIGGHEKVVVAPCFLAGPDSLVR